MSPRGRPSRQIIYERLDTQIDELWGRIGGLPSPAEATGIWRDIWYQEAHHSTAIEGNTLVLEPGTWSDGSLICLAEGRRVHEAAMTPVWDVEPHPESTSAESPGSFREHEIQRFPGGLMPPSWVEGPAAMR